MNLLSSTSVTILLSWSSCCTELEWCVSQGHDYSILLSVLVCIGIPIQVPFRFSLFFLSPLLVSVSCCGDMNNALWYRTQTTKRVVMKPFYVELGNWLRCYYFSSVSLWDVCTYCIYQTRMKSMSSYSQH